MVIRSYSVFAAEQVTGYPIEVPDTAGDNHRNQQAEEYFRRTGAKLHSGLIEPIIAIRLHRYASTRTVRHN